MTIVAYRRKEWLGKASLNADAGFDDIQEIVDMLTKRGPRSAK